MLTAVAFSSGQSLTPQEEAAFFAALRLGNGTFKTTYDHRMDDLNEFMIARWRATAFRPAKFMDIGVSSGISTVEWFEALQRDGFQPRMTATDLALWGRIVSLWPGMSVLESGGCILQHMILGIPIRPWLRRLDYFTGYALLSALANKLAVRCRARREGDPILLVSSRARRHSGIEWLEDDILGENPARFIGRFDTIRAANILNADYFSGHQLERAVVNLRDRLAGPNARLIVNRTLKEGSNHATMFRLTDANRFEVEARFGRGSEIEHVVVAV